MLSSLVKFLIIVWIWSVIWDIAFYAAATKNIYFLIFAITLSYIAITKITPPFSYENQKDNTDKDEQQGNKD